ncbi:urease accessory protein UreH [Gluconacetobacter sacchari DSM 12717]|nr:urease accessory protein UreH [Gluconacetobacter sacchari DSM 12717]
MEAEGGGFMVGAGVRDGSIGTVTTLQRARGHFRLAVRPRDGRVGVADLEQGGCCRLLFPKRAQAALEAVTVNISGGIAAGDRIAGALDCAPETDLLVTSQAAERIYRARAGDGPAEIDVSCRIGAGARLEWLPHGTIFFDGCRLRRHMRVEMAASSSFLFLECRMFGRIGSGETLHRLDVRDRLSVRREGRAVLEDMFRLESTDVSALLANRAVAAGQAGVATLVLVSADAEGRLDRVRDRLGEIGDGGFACSAWNGMLVVRGVSSGGRGLEDTVQRLLPALRDARPVPATWRS